VEALAERGAVIEFTYLTCMPGGFAATHDPKTFAAAMMRIGPQRVVMSTDFGQAKSPHPAEGMRMFIDEMLGQGVPAPALELMARRNAARLLGIGE
jgi:predicted TIM-barrel fold metal-dependent hydrolase